MKKLKFLLFALISTSIITTSCSTDEDVNINAETQQNNFALKSNKVDVDKFIGNFYGNSFVYGDSVTAVDTARTYMVKEIIVGTDIKARGYIAIDQASKTPVGFIDVDRTNAVMKSYDFENEEFDSSDDLSLDPVFNDNGYDLIQLITEGNKYQTQGWFVWVGWIFTMDNFWGTTVEHGPCHTEEIGGTFQQVHTVTISKRRFWIRWSSPTVIENVPC